MVCKTILLSILAFQMSLFAGTINNSLYILYDSWRIDPSYSNELFLPDTSVVTGNQEDLYDAFGISDAFLSSNSQYLENYSGREEVLSLNSDSELNIYLASFTDLNSTLLEIEITYFSPTSSTVLPAIYLTAPQYQQQPEHIYSSTIIETDNWLISSFQLTLEQSGLYQNFDINFFDTNSISSYPVYIDSIIIQSTSIPEPAVLTLLTSGIFIAISRTGKKNNSI